MIMAGHFIDNQHMRRLAANFASLILLTGSQHEFVSKIRRIVTAVS